MGRASLLHLLMKRNFYTTEFISTVLVLLAMLWLNTWSVASLCSFTLMLNAYQIGRALFKRNRSLMDPGEKTTEFWALVAAQMWVMVWLWKGLPADLAVMVLGLNQGVYCLARGWTKGTGNKSQQTIIR